MRDRVFSLVKEKILNKSENFKSFSNLNCSYSHCRLYWMGDASTYNLLQNSPKIHFQGEKLKRKVIWPNKHFLKFK